MKQIDVEQLAQIAPLLATLQAWREFKRSHNIADAKICCCRKTLKLFDALDELEREVIES